jgi:ferritin-like metal-binding protein YciE
MANLSSARGGSFASARLPACHMRKQTAQPNSNIMSKLNTLEDLLVQEIKDLYSAENQLVKALPKMANGASNPALKKGIEKHLEETKVHVQRLEQIAELLEASPKGKACKAMQGLVEEGSEILGEEGDDVVKDLAIIGAAQKVEHYEIASYGTARALAETLGMEEVAELLQETLDEEGATDKALTAVAEDLSGNLPDEEDDE